MNEIIFTLGTTPVTLIQITLGAAGLMVILLATILITLMRAGAARRAEITQQLAQATSEATRVAEMERHMADLIRTSSEMKGRMETMGEVFGRQTTNLTKTVSDSIEGVKRSMNQSITETREKTQESLSQLHLRLAVIDKAQDNITALSTNIVSLQDILSNKQSRGAFGQGRMEAIIADGLPSNGFSFQATLSNGKRPDALIHMPGETPDLAIDAKFPLEAWQLLEKAKTPQEEKTAASQFRNDIYVHIKDISEKYLIPGETQDTAFMFVPSEAMFADIHERFEDLVQRAMRARVIIVSPSLLMLSIQVIQALLRDVRMREQAHVIQQEVTKLMGDVTRLGDRVQKLQTHFGQANKDIDDILISTGKITKRGESIESLEFEEADKAQDQSRLV